MMLPPSFQCEGENLPTNTVSKLHKSKMMSYFSRKNMGKRRIRFTNFRLIKVF